MNVNKAIFKVDFSKSLGSKFAGMREAANRDLLRQEGARDALKMAAQRVGDLGTTLRKDLEEGVLSASDLKDAQKVKEFIHRYIKRAVGVIDNLATTAEVARTIASGRQKGLQAAEDHVREIGESEVKKLEELQKQLSSGDIVVEDPEGTNFGHPGLPLKYQREDEAKADQAEKAPTKAPPRKKPTLKKKPVPKRPVKKG